MKVFTVINDREHPGFNLLRLSCAINNLQLIALLYKEETFDNNRLKDEILVNYLEDHVQNDEIIFFTDGNDAILMCSEEEILNKFYQTGKELVFSTESACWPDKNLAEQYPDTTSIFRYLNSGGFIGKAGIIKKILKDDLGQDKNFEKSNQYTWTKRLFRYPDIIGLDTTCEIFQTFSPEIGEQYWPPQHKNNTVPYYRCMKEWFATNFKIENGRLFSIISGTWPCHAHFNGPSKYILDIEIIDMVFAMLPGSYSTQFIDGVYNSPEFIND